MMLQLYRKKFSQETTGTVSLKAIITTGLMEFMGFFGYIVDASVGLVSIATPVSSASPAVTILLAQAFLKEMLAQIQKVAVVFIILGIVLLPILPFL